ncbi:MAG TPA: hypothetical protein VIM02_05150, partial [Rhizomicrobium sp.]
MEKMVLPFLAESASFGWRDWRMPVSAIPEIRRFVRGDRLGVQAQQVWLILCGQAMFNRETMQYGTLAKLMGYDPRAGHVLNRQLGIVGVYCRMNGLPTLNSIVVGRITKLPGSGVVLSEGRSERQQIAAVLKENWFAIR